MTGSRGSRGAGQGKLRASLPTTPAATLGGPGGLLRRWGTKEKVWGEGTPLPACRCPSPSVSLPPGEGRRAARTHLGGAGGRAGSAPLGRSEARRAAEPLRLGARGTRLHTEPCNPGSATTLPGI